MVGIVASRFADKTFQAAWSAILVSCYVWIRSYGCIKGLCMEMTDWLYVVLTQIGHGAHPASYIVGTGFQIRG